MKGGTQVQWVKMTYSRIENKWPGQMTQHEGKETQSKGKGERAMCMRARGSKSSRPVFVAVGLHSNR